MILYCHRNNKLNLHVLRIKLYSICMNCSIHTYLSIQKVTLWPDMCRYNLNKAKRQFICCY